MIDILFAGAGWLLVSRIARRRGFRGPLPGVMGALAYFAGGLLAAVLYGVVSGDRAAYDPARTLEGGGDVGRILRGEPAYTIPVVAGVLLIIATALCFAFIPVRMRGPEYQRRSRFPYRTSGVFLILIGVLCLFLQSRYGYGSFLGFGAFALAAGAFARGKRARAMSDARIILNDARPKVLYLRAFELDRLADAATSPTIIPFERKRGWEEEFCAVISKQVGPVVALGSPGDDLPFVGAARAYVPDANWFEEFRSLAQAAACVVVVPSSSPGLLREIRHVREHVAPGRVFVTFPEFVDDVWRPALRRLEEAGMSVPRADCANTVVGFTDDWSHRIVGADLRTPQEFAQAVYRTVTNPADSLYRGSLRKFRASWWFRIGWAIGALLTFPVRAGLAIAALVRGRVRQKDADDQRTPPRSHSAPRS